MTYTRGNVIVENIKIGDVHFEYEYGLCIKSVVETLPVRSSEGYWTWTSKAVDTNRLIKYGVNEMYQAYAPNLYDYEAYSMR